MLFVSLRPRLLSNKLVQAAVLIVVALSLVASFSHYRERFPLSTTFFHGNAPPPAADPGSEDAAKQLETEREGNATLIALAPKYIQAIMNPKDDTFQRLECRDLNEDRYGYLRVSAVITHTQIPHKYFFAIDLQQSASLLPRLIGSIVETMNFIGPEVCSLSIVEGHSNDGTFEILKLLRAEIEKIGATYHFVSSGLNTRVGERIATLAELRNMAVEPLVKTGQLRDTTVVFLNDVALCSEDIMELVHQRQYQHANMTCGMDWTYVGQDPTFYDVWIARGMTGDSFFNIPEDGNWNSAWNLFWNDPAAKSRLDSHKPFQVYSCWNGAAVFGAEVLSKVKFRHAVGKECYQGEPKLFCKDMWHEGFGRIAVVPTVNIEYSDEQAKKIKALKGYVSDWVDKIDGSQEIEWQEKPPEKVKCMKNYDDQIWIPWDEGL